MVKNKAYTQIEILFALVLLGVLLLFSTLNINTLIPDINRSRYQKTYSDIENAVTSLLKNEDIYSSFYGFSDTRAANLPQSNISIGYGGETSKFREAIKYQLGISKTSIPCALPYNFTISNPAGCFKLDNGTVIGIVDTDFKTNGVVSISELRTFKNRARKKTVEYAPILVFTNYKKAHRYTDAQYIGVSAKGRLVLLGLDGNNLVKLTNTSLSEFSPSLNCSSSVNLSNVQCKAIKYLKTKITCKSST